VAKKKKEQCVGCGKTFTLKAVGDSTCRPCGVVYVRQTLQTDGWSNRRLVEGGYQIDLLVSPDKEEYVLANAEIAPDLVVWRLPPNAGVERYVKRSTFSSTRGIMMASKKTKGTGKGRTSSAAGKYIFKVDKAASPYRETSHIGKTYGKLSDGMTFEKAIAQAQGKKIEIYAMVHQGTIVLSDGKTRPTAATMTKMVAKQAHGLTGEGRTLPGRQSNGAKKAKAKAAPKKAVKKAKAKAAPKKAAPKKAAKAAIKKAAPKKAAKAIFGAMMGSK
jgi:hypothetical protein